MTDFGSMTLASTQVDGGILYNLARHGVSIQFRRDGALMAAQPCVIVPLTRSAQPQLGNVQGAGEVATIEYVLIGKADLDVQRGDLFSYLDPADALNFEVESVNRTYAAISGHIEASLRELQ